MWVTRVVDCISDLVAALVAEHTVVLILSSSYWAHLACHGLDYAFMEVARSHSCCHYLFYQLNHIVVIFN